MKTEDQLRKLIDPLKEVLDSMATAKELNEASKKYKKAEESVRAAEASLEGTYRDLEDKKDLLHKERVSFDGEQRKFAARQISMTNTGRRLQSLSESLRKKEDELILFNNKARDLMGKATHMKEEYEQKLHEVKALEKELSVRAKHIKTVLSTLAP